MRVLEIEKGDEEEAEKERTRRSLPPTRTKFSELDIYSVDRQ